MCYHTNLTYFCPVTYFSSRIVPFLYPLTIWGIEAGAGAIFISRHVAKSLAAWEAIRGQQGEQGDVLWDQVDGVRSPKTIKKAFQVGQTVTKCNL